MTDFCTAFPDFPAADFPDLPAGFTDSSFVNDACPSIKNETLGLLIFIDWADPTEREYEGGRFIVYAMDADGIIADSKTLISTDDWSAVITLIAERTDAVVANVERRTYGS